MPEPVAVATAAAPGHPQGAAGDRTALIGSGLELAYGSHVVVHDADVRLSGGRVTALVGPNGSGKSTLLRALARLHGVKAGTIALDGDVDALDLSAREFATRVTLLAQSRQTPAGISVRELVGYGRHPYRRRWRADDPEGPLAVASAMAATGITELADRAVDALSGGQVQRVWLAACLAQDTPALLLDEPTTFLDLRYQVETLDLIRDLADTAGVAVGVVLHDLDQAAAVADDVVLMSDGRVAASGAPMDVLTGPLLTDVYGIEIAVDVDPGTGALRTRPVGRHNRDRRTDRPDHMSTPSPTVEGTS